MMRTKTQIINTVAAFLMILLLFVLALGLDSNESFEFSKINIIGNSYQSAEQYFAFANLQQCIDQQLSIRIIRDRLEKRREEVLTK